MTPRRPFPNLTSIATVSISGSLPEKLEAAAQIGFEAVEIFENDLLTFDGTPREIRELASNLGLEICIFQPFRDFEALPEPMRGRNMDRAERKFDLMQALGSDLVLVCSNTQPATIGDPARAAADLAEMAERAARRGLRVGFEALAWGRHTNRWRQAWDIVKAVDHPALGLILDSFHTLCLGDTLDGLEEVPADKLMFLQLADAPLLSMDVLSWSRHYRNFPGQGQLAVTPFLRKVLDCGYTGPVSLEIFNDDFRAMPSRITARDALRSLVALGSAVGESELPAVAVFDGVEFIEFALDAVARENLAEFVAGLGFRRIGVHRSKDVELWRQGRIHLVLNAEQDTAAAEHFLLHGPSVCALALRVDDAARALARARALLCPDWQERTGRGERQIPALRAPDGTLIYLVEPSATGRSIFEDDFILDIPEDEPTLLGETDHIAQVLPAGRLDSYALFYSTVFGFTAQATLELPDPLGLIRSRAMISADGTLRLPLSISESRETGIGRFVSAFAGAGVQHIAFSTEDIFSTVDHLRLAGLDLLPIPPNYYDDLEARHGLDDDTLYRLRENNLLFDRDEHGDFLHGFTETFDDRFFFEIVQRNGYQGFGASNASVRMAVQAQRRDASRLGVRLAVL